MRLLRCTPDLKRATLVRDARLESWLCDFNIIVEETKVLHVSLWLLRFKNANSFEVQILYAFPISSHEEFLRMQIGIRKKFQSILIEQRE